MAKSTKSNQPVQAEDIKGSGVQEGVSEFSQEYPSVGNYEVDGDEMVAERERTFGDGSEETVEAPVEIEAEDATVETDSNGAEGVTLSDGTVVTEADMAQVGAVPSGVDQDGNVGGYDPTPSRNLLRPGDAAPYVSSEDEQRDQAYQARLAELSAKHEQSRREAEESFKDSIK